MQFSEACERNKGPLLAVLERWLPRPAQVLEVGSGTGQHALHFTRQLAQLGPKLSVWGLEALPAGGPGLPLSLVAVAGIPGTVVAWRKLPRRRAKVESALPVSEYARRFDLREEVIEEGRRAAVTVVHHHADGRIASIECREAA